MDETEFLIRVEAVRRFNRFYTKRIGVLLEGLLESPFSLAEARVIYELAHHEDVSATELGNELGLDAGYLSRLLRGLRHAGIVRKAPSETDGRRSLLHLTKQGQEVFAMLNSRSRNQFSAMLGELSTEDQARLVAAMHTIERVLGARPEHKVPYILRLHQPGDMGWIVHRNAVLYAEEYGWDERFEALVATITADFIENHDPKRERCWIVEMDGAIVGSVFLVGQTECVAKLRLLWVEPKARGLGIGTRLVDECANFARRTGYRKITLWTNSILHAARHIYVEAGFSIVDEEPHHSFGHDLVGQTWELELRRPLG